MGLPESFGAPYIATIGDATVEFPMLKMTHLALLAKVIEKRRLDRLNKTADAQQLKGEAKARFIAVGETEEIEIGHIHQYASSFEGSRDVCSRSLQLAGKVKGEADAWVDQLDPMEARMASMWAVGCLAPVKSEGEKGANPPSGGEKSDGKMTDG